MSDNCVYVHIFRQLDLSTRNLDYRSCRVRPPFCQATPRLDRVALLDGNGIFGWTRLWYMRRGRRRRFRRRWF